MHYSGRGTAKRGFETRRRRKTSGSQCSSGRMAERYRHLHIYVQAPAQTRPFESPRTSRLDDREEIEICDDYADEISVSFNGGLGPKRSERGASLPRRLQIGIVDVRWSINLDRIKKYELSKYHCRLMEQEMWLNFITLNLILIFFK